MADSVVGDIRGISSQLHTFTYLWRIENFGKLDSTVGKYYDSDFFQPDDANNKLNMCLRIYLRSKESGSISCALYSKESSVPEEGVFLNYSIQFLNSDGKKLGHLVSKGLLQPGKVCGFPTPAFATRIPDDTLIVLVDGRYSLSTLTKNKSTEHLAMENHLEKLIHDFEHSLRHHFCSDFRIIVGTCSYPAHEALLRNGEPKIASEGRLKRDELPMVKKYDLFIQGFSFDIVEKLLEFLHKGTTDIYTFNEALDLLYAADKFKINKLKNYCSTYLIIYMKNENVVQMLLTAYATSADLLKREATKQLIENLSNINSEQRKKLVKENPNILFDIIEAMKNKKKCR